MAARNAAPKRVGTARAIPRPTSASGEPSPGPGSRSPISRQLSAPDPTTTSATTPSDTPAEIRTDARMVAGPSGQEVQRPDGEADDERQ